MGSSISPIALLTDANGNQVKITLDNGNYRLEVTSKNKNAAGTLINPATEEKLETVRVLLNSLDGKDFATQTTVATLATESKLEAVRALVASLDSKDFATQTTLATLATESKLEEVRALLNSLDGKDFATQTTLAAADTKLAAIGALLTSIDGKDFATEATLVAVDAVLDSIKDVDGIRKIVEALPTGDNVIGQVKITGENGQQVSIHFENNKGMISTRDEQQIEILRGIWKELRLVRFHVEQLTNERVSLRELSNNYEDISGG